MGRRVWQPLGDAHQRVGRHRRRSSADWTIASNFTASTLLTITKPFALGERIEILPEGVRGRAIDRSMMFTILREDNGSTVSIPNNLIFQRIVRCEGGRRRRGVDDYEDWHGDPPRGPAADPDPSEPKWRQALTGDAGHARAPAPRTHASQV